MDENLILYDWLSFTCKKRDPYYFVDLLGLSKVPWELTKGARGYKDRLYFNCISIHFNGRDDMGIWCEMSGQGCRAFESLTTLRFLVPKISSQLADVYAYLDKVT